ATPIVWGNQCAQPISPPVGEMPGRAEGDATRTARTLHRSTPPPQPAPQLPPTCAPRRNPPCRSRAPAPCRY
ncbi:hypothetical protein ELH71_04590, partial [Rhizobium ruizarguesonis]